VPSPDLASLPKRGATEGPIAQKPEGPGAAIGKTIHPRRIPRV